MENFRSIEGAPQPRSILANLSDLQRQKNLSLEVLTPPSNRIIKSSVVEESPTSPSGENHSHSISFSTLRKSVDELDSRHDKEKGT
jgi:hypothetical protein